MPSTEIQDYWRRAWGIGDRVGFEAGSKKGKPFIDPKRVKLEKILSDLPKGSIVDTGKLMDRTGVDSTRMGRLLKKYDHKNFKVIKSKRIKADIERTGKIFRSFTDAEYELINKLYSSKYKGLKDHKLVKALYADGKNNELSLKLSEWHRGVKVGEQLIVKPEVIKVYHELKKKLKRPPRVNEIYEKVKHLYPSTRSREGIIQNISRNLRDTGLKWTMGVEKIHTTSSDRSLAERIKRDAKIKEFSLKSVEDATKGKKGFKIPAFEIGPFKFKGAEIGSIHKHHMNSLRGNVNLRNIAYIPGSLNWGVLKATETDFGNLYRRRETILKKKLPGWQKALDAINAEGEAILKKLPQKARGLLNFKVVTADSSGKLKFSNKGIDWTLSVGRDAGEIGKMDFKKLTKSQQEKVIAIAKENFKYASPKLGATVAGTLGGLGLGVGAAAAGAEYQAGKPLYDVFVNLPIEFASFGMIPATEISQQLRIRGDLKNKGLSLAERNEKMALYNRAKAQEAIEQDVGEVGLESYALSGLGEGETKDQAYSIKEDEGIELLKRKINRGYNVETGRWEDSDPIAFEEAMLSKGGIANLKR